MAHQDPPSSARDKIQAQHFPVGCAGVSPRLGKWSLPLLLTLGLALLAAGCVRFKYDETATAVPAVVPSPTSALVAPSPTPQDATRDETPVPTVSGPMVLRTDPAVVDLAVGETRLVQVCLDNVEQVHSVELHIDFDPRTVRIEDADPGTEGVQIGTGAFLASAQVIRNEVDNGAGHIVYQVTALPGDAVSGNGVVAAFTARGLAEGGSPLKFTAIGLRDPSGGALNAPQRIDGIVVVEAGEPVAEQTAVPRPVASPAPTPGEDVYHTVQPGENLFRIALRYGTTVDAIVAANHLPGRDSVRAGQELLIPVGGTGDTNTYVVQAGDTLYSIARRYGTTVEALASLNGLGPSDPIAVGQTLRVP